jgi:PAS domain-containing protein
MRIAPWRTVRGRLLLLALLVEALMLSLLVANSLRLVRESMGQQARSQAEQIVPVLKAALIAPLAQSDQATVQAVLNESTAVPGIDYIVVTDSAGSVVAQSGWLDERNLPVADARFEINPDEKPPRYDVVQPIELAGQQLGTIHFGLNLTRIIEARQALLTQGIAIAGVELLMSAALLTLLGLMITRQLSVLTRASTEVASGNFTPPPVPEGDDDMGHLGAAFNAMSRAVAERIEQISQARDTANVLLAAIEQEHLRLSALLAAMDFGVLFTNEDDRVVYANQTLLGLLKLPKGSLDVGTALDTIAPRIAQRLTDPGRWQRDIVWASTTDLELPLANGRILTLHRRPVGSDGEGILGQVWIFTDVTDERHAEQQLRTAKEAAEAAN